MFFSKEQLELSIKRLGELDPFFGTVFLALKQANLPEGETKPLKFQPLLEAFLQKYYRPTNNSTEIYMPFKMSNKRKYWNISQCITTLQRNTIDTFSDVILHPKRTREWGWKTDYMQVLLQKHLATRPNSGS